MQWELKFNTEMKCFLLTLYCLAMALVSSAMGLPSYQRISLNHDDGLCDDYVRYISQDAHGYVWVVTNHGLNRFDGNSFKRFTKENSGLTTSELNCVLQDPEDDDLLWIGSRFDGLFCYSQSTGKITPVDVPLHTSDITALSVSSDSQIWITHYNSPPEKFNPSTKELQRIFSSDPEGFPYRIWCSVEDPSGRYMYLGHESFGMTRIDLTTKKYEEFPCFGTDLDESRKGSVYSLYAASGGYVWAGTDEGVYIFDPFSRVFSRPGEMSDSKGLPIGPVKAIHAMSDGTVWAGTSSGISLFSPSGRKLNAAEIGRIPGRSTPVGFRELSSSAPSAIFEDGYGNKWVGYNGHGLDVLNPALGPVSFYFSTADDGKSLYETPVWSVRVSSGKDVWIGGERLLTRVSGDSHRSYTLLHQRLTPVRCIYEDDEETVWVGTSNSGAFRMKKGESGFSPVKDIDNEVRDFVAMPGFGMLAATHNGIYKIGRDGVAAPSTLFNGQMSDFYATSLLLASGGTLIVGTFGHGILAFDSSGHRSALLDKRDGLPSSTVNDIKEGPDHRIWIATRDGLAICDQSGLKLEKVIRTDDGVHSSNFKAIEFGRDGRAWISAEDGIACYSIAADRLSFFHKANKALLGSFIEGASAVTPSGNILFGSLNGMKVLDLDFASSVSASSNTRVTEMLANDSKGIDHDIEISLPVNSGRMSIPYNLNTFTLKFSDPDISTDINSEIRYNMKGVNDVWTNSEGRNEAVYRNLKPGKYEFRISTRYFGGEWSDPETILTIDITPPLYLTWWAKTFYVLVVLMILAVVMYFYRYKSDLEKNLETERENSRVDRLLNEEKLMFYTNVTHELRTPLSLIIGPIEDMVNSTDICDENRRKLHTIRSSAIRLLNLINSILEFRKTETCNRHLEVTYVNMANVVREVALRFKELNNNRHVSYVIDVARMEGRDVYFDPEIITTVLNNLIGNAAKYTRQGEISVSLKPENVDGIEYVDLIVADTGEGISDDELPHIFKRFYQGAHNRKVAGTGIGLALVKNLVEIHEASICVKSEIGKGSTFVVRFVADNSYPSARHKDADVAGDESRGSLEDAAGMDSKESRLTVLVVEDDEDVRAYIETSLSSTYHVVTAEDGEKGWEIVRKIVPDAVVSDIMMPKMNGIELCRKIKDDFTLNHIPVILLTAKDSLLDKEEGYESGADSYITKPFSSKLLLSRIRNIIEARHRLSIRYINMKAAEAEVPADSECPAPSDVLHDEDFSPQESDMLSNGDCTRDLPPADKEFIDRFRRLIEENIEQQELDIAFLTDKMCMSHSTLYRKVKSITGLTPNEFTRKIKLARAVEILRSGEHDIAKVTVMTGFNSPSYFRRVFKKEYGLSPSEYIEQTID